MTESEIERIARLRRDELRAQLRLEPRRMADALTRAEATQQAQLPGLDWSQVATRTLQVDEGNTFDKRDLAKAMEDAIQQLRTIIPGAQATQFAQALSEEGGAGINHAFLFLFVDNFSALRELILKRFRTKTTAPTLYTYIINRIKKDFDDGQLTGYVPNLTSSEAFSEARADNQRAQLVQAETLAEQRANQTEADLAVVTATQKTTPLEVTVYPLVGVPLADVTKYTPLLRILGKDKDATGDALNSKPMGDVYRDVVFFAGDRWNPTQRTSTIQMLRVIIAGYLQTQPRANTEFLRHLTPYRGGTHINQGASKASLVQIIASLHDIEQGGPIPTPPAPGPPKPKNPTVLDDTSDIFAQPTLPPPPTRPPTPPPPVTRSQSANNPPTMTGTGYRMKPKGRGMTGGLGYSNVGKVQARGGVGYDGLGKTKPRFILGGGCSPESRSQAKEDRAVVDESYRWTPPGKPTVFVDLRRLQDNKLCVRYRTSNQMLISPTLVTEGAKCVILDILTRKQFRRELFESLSAEEQQTIEHLIHVIGFDKELDDYRGPVALKELRQQYDILRGQIDAGNNHPKIKQRLISVLTELVNRKVLGVSHGRQLVLKYTVI